MVVASLPSPSDVEELITNLAEDDRNEILALGFTVEFGIRDAVARSTECFAFRVPEGLACITGVSDSGDLGSQVTPWLIGTPVMQRYRREVLRGSRFLLNRWSRVYPFMSSYVDARHTRAIRWLKWLGAELEFIPEFGPFKAPFYKFTFGSDQWVS